MSVATRASTGPAFCPHCFLRVEAEVPLPWPPSLARCPHCRLTIGPGRAHASTADAGPGARGTAAGVVAHEARVTSIDEGDEDALRERVRVGIRSVAESEGARPERLLMIDYQQAAATEPDLPSLPEVFAAFGSWKRARRESVED